MTVRLLLTALLSLWSASTTSGQTVSAQFEIPQELLTAPWSVGPGPHTAPKSDLTAAPIDADGNPLTSEWLLHLSPRAARGVSWHQWYRLVVVHPLRICAGAWFRPHGEASDATITVTRVNGRDVFVVNWRMDLRDDTITGVRVIALDVPQCP